MREQRLGNTPVRATSKLQEALIDITSKCTVLSNASIYGQCRWYWRVEVVIVPHHSYEAKIHSCGPVTGVKNENLRTFARLLLGSRPCWFWGKTKVVWYWVRTCHKGRELIPSGSRISTKMHVDLPISSGLRIPMRNQSRVPYQPWKCYACFIET